jgi:hypothetical protein
LARCLIIGCGCRGGLLARELVAAGHLVRGTTRDPRKAAAIEAAGAEPVVADPDRVATLMGALDGVSVVAILLGSADGSRSELEALHGTRLQMLLTKLVDTKVRGVAYEVRGGVAGEILEAGAERVRAYAYSSHAACELLAADPGHPASWVADAVGAVERVLGGAGARLPGARGRAAGARGDGEPPADREPEGGPRAPGATATRGPTASPRPAIACNYLNPDQK